MKQEAADKTTKINPIGQFSIGSVGLQFLDTTWRMAVPVLLFTGLGIFIDLHIGSKPWMTLLFLVIGFAFAVILVKKQIEAVEKSEGNK